MPFDSWISLAWLESFWWTVGLFFAAGLIEMWFPPFPGDAVYFIGLWTISSGNHAVAAALIAAFCGGFTGFIGLYWLGRARGRRVFMRKKKGLWSETTLVRIEGWFQHWGGWVIVFGRFIAGVRSAVPLVAGIIAWAAARQSVSARARPHLWSNLDCPLERDHGHCGPVTRA